ncbi:non-ribosomal peptide synthetase [Streptomyces sp. NPDC058783]|uniref:non-ribosomal peptide synthetase n=1 Tax=Streptomyces sp. NPDC058783 TaxID=3346633 RepID=UPI0036AF9D7B
MNPESTAEHEKPSTRPGLHVAGDHRAPHAAVSHVVRRRPDPDGSGTALRAAVLATMVRYCRGGRVDVADHREVRSYDVDLDSPLGELLELAATDGVPRPRAAEASVALLPVGRAPVVDATLCVQWAGEGAEEFVVASPARRHGPVAVRQFADAVRTFLEVFAEADGPSLAQMTVASVGILDAGHDAAVGRGPVLPPAGEQVHRTVARLAVEAPDRPAVEDGDVVLTYRRLAGAMLATRDRMRAAGVTAHDAVAVAMDRGAGSAVAQLAAFAAECRVVLVDPTLPAARIRYMLRDSRAALVAVASPDHEVARLAASLGLATLVPDTDPAQAHPPEPEPRGSAAALPELPEHAVSHIAYTSGSTGEPKAVQLRHGPMRNTATALAEACGLSAATRGSWFCPPGVGMVEVDMFPVLAAGGTVVVAPVSVGTDPVAVQEWLLDHRISHTLQTTVVAEHLLKMAWPAKPALVSMRVAGERQRLWPPADCPFQVLNVYGSTEANVVAVCDLTELVREGAGQAGLAPPIGRPVRNVALHILDEELRPLPRHAVGELCISGRSLSRGYLNHEAANAQRFLPNPLPGEEFPVLYRSGDLARMDGDGLVDVVGRMDDEVKIRGYRVHPGAVERELSTLPGVAACAVIAEQPDSGESRLVGFVERAPGPVGSALDPSRVRKELERLLPAYMVPAVLTFGPLPVNRNGKIDRAALRERPRAGHRHRAPASETERRLVELFAQVLGQNDVGADDHFFELGGSSLSAALLVRKAGEELGAELTMVDLMEAPTAARLALRCTPPPPDRLSPRPGPASRRSS